MFQPGYFRVQTVYRYETLFSPPPDFTRIETQKKEAKARDSDFGTTEDAGERNGDLGRILTPWPVATGGVYFQTGLSRIVCRLIEFLHWSYAEKGDIPFFSAVDQLLLAAHGRERLSHKSSSNWALLCTRCLPRWRYRSR
jgi:hypothetical protein